MNNKFRGMKSLAVFDTTNSFKIKSNTINTVNIISDNIQTSSYTSSAVNTVVTPSVVYDGTYTVNANGSHNYVLAFNIIDNINLIQLGQKLNIKLNNGELNVIVNNINKNEQ